MSVSKVIVGVSIVCGVALTVFIWMPLFVLGGVFGIATSFFSDGCHWYGHLYAERDDEYRRQRSEVATASEPNGEIAFNAQKDESVDLASPTHLDEWMRFPNINKVAWR